ncbi:hypothetical protein DFH09DRAFT_1163766 [Mycena vulgaris]|nr:hypothetical protein DFH09DRAFT_1163766 [Mycena vulgaris]
MAPSENRYSFSQAAVSNGLSATPTQESPPEFFQLASSIRALSTAIHEIPGRCEFRTRSSCEACVTDKDRTKVFSHLATLLTMGSPLGRQTVAVTGGSSHHGFYINVGEMIARNEQDGAPDRPASRVPAVKMNAILPSRKSLKQLAQDKRPLSQITFTEHASDVFQALRLLSHGMHSGERRTFECFIVRRCHSEINRRLQTAIGLLDPPLHDILGTWNLHSTDEIREEWVVIPYPLLLVENFSIPHRRMVRWPNRIELLFNRETFGAWKTFFISLLRVVSSTVSGLLPETSGSTTDAVLSLHFLRLFLSFGPARVILNAPSLKPILLGKLLPRHKLDFSERYRKSPTDIILRAWNAIVAYDSAISSLTSRHCTASAILRHALPTVHAIVLPAAAPKSSAMDSIPHIMRTKVIPALNLSKSHMGALETLIAQHLSLTEFPGAVHCEASMMGVAYAYGWGALDAAFHDAFEGPSNTVGITDRPCQICAWLAEELLLPNGPFILRASHGRVVPWSPPCAGLPLAVLRSLELELLGVLMEATQGWLEQQTRRPRK